MKYRSSKLHIFLFVIESSLSNVFDKMPVLSAGVRMPFNGC